MHASAQHSVHDVIIMGGGLAGLTLALQLRQALPELKILILERRAHPVPEAAHKVGESSVEIAANYFDTVLGLQDHLRDHQLRKFGFRFFFSEAHEHINQVLELGASHHLSTPSYQIDRGIFENFLGGRARQQGVQFLDGAVIRKFSLSQTGEPHSVEFEFDGSSLTASGRWLIDASGRAGLIKKHLALALDNGHQANAAWFRLATRLDVNDWSDDTAWLQRCTPPDRWLSTNHLVGPGYWAWLIPLSSGSHSVGIVADSRLHPSQQLDSFEKTLSWLDTHQPQLARAVRKQRDRLQDFAYLRSFSYGCKQVFSAQRWALTGESGVFLDPFYSPGGDFIAIANTYITDLVVQDFSGKAFGKYAAIYERFFFSFYESTLTLFRDQYPMFGNTGVFPIKVIWDYTYYWGVLCQLFFQRRLTDIAGLGRLRAEMTGAVKLNGAMQDFLRAWALADPGSNRASMIDQASLDWFARLNAGLRDDLDDVQFAERLRSTTTLLQALASEIVAAAQASCTTLDSVTIRAMLHIPSGMPSGVPLLSGVLPPHKRRAMSKTEAVLP